MSIGINDNQPCTAQFQSRKSFREFIPPLPYLIRIGCGRILPSFDRWSFLPSPIRPLEHCDWEYGDAGSGMV
jgi:hypothetical protein